MKVVGIIGYGEIGSSLEKVYLGRDFLVQIKDTTKGIYNLQKKLDILNICIPYIDPDQFITAVGNYIKEYNPQLTIIHSTVVPGTTKKIQENYNVQNLVHSPVRGVHPNLYEGIKTFVKYVGSNNTSSTELAVQHFKELDIKFDIFSSSTATELAKILDTTYYGVCIAFHNDINNLCTKYGVKFSEVATKYNNSYNEGYEKLGMHNVARPVLYPPKDGKIGGHCVVPNAELCKTFFNSLALDYILQLK